MRIPGYRSALTFFLSLAFLFLAAQNAPGAGDKRQIEQKKDRNISFEVPAFLPPEAVEGGEEKGTVIFASRTERGMFERLFAVSWGKQRQEVMSFFPAERYRLSSGEREDDKETRVNGHAVSFSKGSVNVTRPCGKSSEEEILICRFSCPETGRQFLFLDLLGTVTKSEFRGIVESFKCH